MSLLSNFTGVPVEKSRNVAAAVPEDGIRTDAIQREWDHLVANARSAAEIAELNEIFSRAI